MSRMIRAVTVYCSSSRHIDDAYFVAGAELGQRIAFHQWRLVYGGNHLGLMGAVADAARAAGGKVTGITPQLLVDQGAADEKCDELIVTADMRQRKALMEERADAFIALPGGLGTLEEFFEIIVGRMLGLHDKPIVLLNTRGFYDPLLAMLDHATDQRFINPRSRKLFFVAATVDDALRHLIDSEPAAPSAPLPAAGRHPALEKF